MKTISFTEFRKHASNLLSEVENGEKLLIMRYGKAIAEISPVLDNEKELSWKKEGLRLPIKGAALSSAIIEEREHENVL